MRPARWLRPMTLAAVVATLVVLPACGDDPPVSSLARDELAPAVDELRAAAAARDDATVRRLVGELRQSVDTLLADGEIDDERAADLVAALAAVEAEVPTITTTTTTSLSPPRAADENGGDQDDKGERPGKGRGRDKDAD